MGNELEGKIAVVTGGAAGLGLAMVERFQAEGAKVVVADIDRAKGAALAEQLGPDVLFVETDVSKSSQVEALVATTVERFGGLHVMVNNAGIPTAMTMRFLDDDLADFQRVIDVDLLGVMLGTQHAGRHMAAHGGGAIINITSIGGIHAGCAEWSYRAAKAGVAHFSKCVAIDLAREDIRVNCIAPGAVVSDILSTATAQLEPGTAEKLRDIMRSIRPLDRQGTPEDIAEAALYFAGERSRYVTGTVLPVDGGMTAGHPNNPLADAHG
ncbi:SDR family oxidoreductase [Saccharopolyspora rhizosphaerae]|uniref:SDR family oxidoreductase n=1 Tax=Saccharopolyspora rhizosphaerae TaxID=2492662 RepID=A0A3R8Q4Q3_9PSEU|nr:SDR family oxidoreductase [Saccharopolyspora rhizosphaerae]RRO16871.1 SDR family oxidoreductase [Saccharopolyspora rhizosphaerae]